LRLIGESGLEDGGVEVLAERLGVGSRHLRRLFLRHLGATPIAVAQTRRLHFAKKLIDETSLPMNQIALASGFGCVRRFNAGIRKVYHRTPTQIRRLARQKEIQSENQYLFHLHFRPPYHWRGMLDFLVARATPGVEVVESDSYRRTISLNGSDGYFEVSPDQGRDALLVRIDFGDPHSLFFIIERIRAMFDLNADWLAIVQSLRSDPVLAGRVEAGRMVSRFGKPFCGARGLTHLFPPPEVLADAKLGDIGLTGARAETIQALARAVCGGKINFEGVVDSDEFLNRLCEIPGIGKWTAQYVAMRALGEPDAFPSSDLGLLRAMALGSSRELAHRAEAWRPWRAYAAMYLWRIGSQCVPRENKLMVV
jgi:AraC family transcriptional regulator of adaptative response / DNA-3-methyladenine glycosylase II